jgi:hypothetical protein
VKKENDQVNKDEIGMACRMNETKKNKYEIWARKGTTGKNICYRNRIGCMDWDYLARNRYWRRILVK